LNTAVIGVGSNIRPHHFIKQAKNLLAVEQHFLKESSFEYTSPIGFSDQPDFLNGAFLVETEMDLDMFQSYLKKLENRLGRIAAANKNGPRIIDLDIIIWNGKILSNDYYERDFVKKAVKEVFEKF
jgi:2-amino-4-hydroxy-6-hydroxymethyldihydropteridine diphosphokinase